MLNLTDTFSDIFNWLRKQDIETLKTLATFIARAKESNDPRQYILDAMNMKLREPEYVQVRVVSQEVDNLVRK